MEEIIPQEKPSLVSRLPIASLIFVVMVAVVLTVGHAVHTNIIRNDLQEQINELQRGSVQVKASTETKTEPKELGYKLFSYGIEMQGLPVHLPGEWLVAPEIHAATASISSRDSSEKGGIDCELGDTGFEVWDFTTQKKTVLIGGNSWDVSLQTGYPISEKEAGYAPPYLSLLWVDGTDKDQACLLSMTSEEVGIHQKMKSVYTSITSDGEMAAQDTHSTSLGGSFSFSLNLPDEYKLSVSDTAIGSERAYVYPEPNFEGDTPSPVMTVAIISLDNEGYQELLDNPESGARVIPSENKPFAYWLVLWEGLAWEHFDEVADSFSGK